MTGNSQAPRPLEDYKTWPTKGGHELCYREGSDDVGMPMVIDVCGINKHTGVITPLNELAPDVRQVLMSWHIAEGAMQRGEAAAREIGSLPESVLRYGGAGVEAHQKVRDAMVAMGERLMVEAEAAKHDLLRSAENSIEGRQRVMFAAPKEHEGATKHGLNTGRGSSGLREI